MSTTLVTNTAVMHELSRDVREDLFLGLATNCSMHFHHQIEIVSCARGKIEVTINHDNFILNEGETVVSGSYDIHGYALTENSVGELLIVPRRYMLGYADVTQKLVLKNHVITDKNVTEDILALEKFIARYLSGNELLLRGAVDAILGLVAQKLSYTAEQSGGDGKFDFVREVLTYINRSFEENITLESLAKKFGYTPNHFSFLFHNYLKTNLREYLNGLRLNKATALIKGGAKVTTAALDAGFNSTRTFYRCFKSVYGMEPGEFLKNNAKR